jgi:hypothetical protein
MVAYSMLEATPQSTEPLASPLSGTLTFAMAIATGLAVGQYLENELDRAELDVGTDSLYLE